MTGKGTTRIDAALANHMASAMITDIEYGWKMGSPDHVPIIIHCQPSNLALNVIKSVDPKPIDIEGIELQKIPTDVIDHIIKKATASYGIPLQAAVAMKNLQAANLLWSDMAQVVVEDISLHYGKHVKPAAPVHATEANLEDQPHDHDLKPKGCTPIGDLRCRKPIFKYQRTAPQAYIIPTTAQSQASWISGTIAKIKELIARTKPKAHRQTTSDNDAHDVATGCGVAPEASVRQCSKSLREAAPNPCNAVPNDAVNNTSGNHDGNDAHVNSLWGKIIKRIKTIVPQHQLPRIQGLNEESWTDPNASKFPTQANLYNMIDKLHEKMPGTRLPIPEKSSPKKKKTPAPTGLKTLEGTLINTSEPTTFHRHAPLHQKANTQLQQPTPKSSIICFQVIGNAYF